MEQPDFTSPPTLRVAAPKPKMTVYYALLIIALACILMACLFLYLEIRRYWQENNGQAIPQRISATDQGCEMQFANHKLQSVDLLT